MKYRIVWTDCAECRGYSDEPLMNASERTFDSIEAAKATLLELKGVKWIIHPEGGEFYPTSQGDTWIMPISTMSPTTHKRDRQKGALPLCWTENTGEVFKSADDIDKVDCVDCLRMLAHHAVLFGNQRRAKRSGPR